MTFGSYISEGRAASLTCLVFVCLFSNATELRSRAPLSAPGVGAVAAGAVLCAC